MIPAIRRPPKSITGAGWPHRIPHNLIPSYPQPLSSDLYHQRRRVSAADDDPTLLNPLSLHVDLQQGGETVIRLRQASGLSKRITRACNSTAQATIGIPSNPPNAAKLIRQSFRDILYSIRLPNNSPLFLSILPRPNGLTVDCVIPNTAAAETHLIQMNRHLPGYLKLYLMELGYNSDGVVDILNRACDPDLTATISQLSWDAKHKVIILPSEAELELDLDKIETEPWMQFVTLPSTFPAVNRKRYNDPDHAFPLNSDLSVTTIHANKKLAEHPSSTTSATTSSSSSHEKEVVIIEPQAQDDVSTLSTMSKGDLVKLLLQFNRSDRRLSGTTGFAPNRETSPHPGTISETPSSQNTGAVGKNGCPVAAVMGE